MALFDYPTEYQAWCVAILGGDHARYVGCHGVFDWLVYRLSV